MFAYFFSFFFFKKKEEEKVTAYRLIALEFVIFLKNQLKVSASILLIRATIFILFCFPFFHFSFRKHNIVFSVMTNRFRKQMILICWMIIRITERNSQRRWKLFAVFLFGKPGKHVVLGWLFGLECTQSVWRSISHARMWGGVQFTWFIDLHVLEQRWSAPLTAVQRRLAQISANVQNKSIVNLKWSSSQILIACAEKWDSRNIFMHSWDAATRARISDNRFSCKIHNTSHIYFDHEV